MRPAVHQRHLVEHAHPALAAACALVLHLAAFHGIEPACLGVGDARGVRVEQLLVHHPLQRAEVLRQHGRKALVFQAQNLLLAAHRHISCETSTTRSSLRHCSSCVSRLPWCVLEKPHCGDRHKCSSPTCRLASSMRLFRESLLSREPLFEDSRPSTTFFPFGRKRSGSKPPARALSNSMKKPSTPVDSIACATGSYPPSATQALWKLPRQVCSAMLMPAGRPCSARSIVSA